MEWLIRLLDIGRVPAKVILWICIISGFLLLTPHEWAVSLKLGEFVNDFGKYIGIVFISSAVLLVLTLFGWMFKVMNNKKKRVNIEKDVSNTIQDLDNSEKAVLREFYIQGRNTIDLPIDNPIVVGLLNKYILMTVGQYGRMSLAGMLRPVIRTSFALKYVNPGIVGLPAGKLTEDQVKKLLSERPSFIKTIKRHYRLLNGL